MPRKYTATGLANLVPADPPKIAEYCDGRSLLLGRATCDTFRGTLLSQISVFPHSSVIAQMGVFGRTTEHRHCIAGWLDEEGAS